MTKSNTDNFTARSQRLLRWLLVALCLAGVPTALVFAAVYRFYSFGEESHKLKLKASLQRATNEGASNLDQEVFWIRLFREKFADFEKENSTPAEILAWLNDLQKQFPNEFTYIAWTPDGKEIARTRKDSYSQQEWQHVFSFFSSQPGVSAKYSKKNYDMTIARKVLGPQLIPTMLRAQHDQEHPSLLWLDSSFVRPPLTRYFLPRLALIIFYDQTLLNKKSGLKHTLQKLAANSQLTLGLTDNTAQILWQTGADKGILTTQLLADCEQKRANFHELPQHYLGYLFLSPDLRIFALSRKEYDNRAIIWRALLGAGFYGLLMLPFLVYTWNTMVAARPGRAKIRTRLAFLFFFACGIPLLAMLIVSHEYNVQMRRTLIAEAHQNSTDMVLSFDRRFLSFLDHDAVTLDRIFDNWARTYAGREFDDAMARAADDQLKLYKPGNYFLIASESKKIINRGDVFILKGSLDAASIDRQRTKSRRNINNIIESDIITANLVGKKIMSDLNRVEISAQILSKLEIVAESLLQQSMLEMTNSVIGNLGSINHWGFGRINDLSFIKLISAIDKGIIDYAIMVFWRPITSQQRFIEAAIPLANRNAQGYRLIARNRLTDRYLPENFNQNADLRNFASRLGARPTDEIEILEVENEEYIAVGFNGRNAGIFQIMALYPLRKIDRAIDEQKTQLLLFALFSIVLAISLAQLLARSFLEPLQELRTGAIAIDNREFSHRIAATGKDEFAEVATVFNEIMVGFGELEVARIVQDSLFPPPLFKHGRFVIFGKSISMSELGGDYFDFFAVDDRHCALLAGDVAGHGVAAALIMAMAKAGIISSSHLLQSPSELLQALHSMIIASRGKQQKKVVMTFQYLYLDSHSGTGRYANAGACSPMLLQQNGRIISELTQTSSPLGVFNHSRFDEMEYQPADGDAIVFYTDGIIEARSPENQVIGYEGFKEILQKAYHPDPQLFYQQIYAAYIEHIGSSEPQDDLTIIISVCQPS